MIRIKRLYAKGEIMVKRLVAVLLVMIVLLLETQAQAPGKAQIAFHSTRNKNTDIYIMDADGQNLRRLTNHPDVDRDPAWSPDGRQIVFDSNRDGQGRVNHHGVYVMDANGKGGLADQWLRSGVV